MFLLLLALFFSDKSEPVLVKNAPHISFFKEQMRYPRFRKALQNKAESLQQALRENGFPQQPKNLFLRVFKRERRLEVWLRPSEDQPFQLFKSFSVCQLSGVLGPKRKQGDRQIPEGFYFVDRFNPASDFHLSLGINYPNLSDRKLGDPRDPGNNIFIHGNCVTIGCVPISDTWIEELYVLAVAAKANGQRKIVVHIFPAELTKQNLAKLCAESPQNKDFWYHLQSIYAYFQTNRELPKLELDQSGLYRLTNP